MLESDWLFNSPYSLLKELIEQTIGHFRVPKNLTFKARLSGKPLI